MFFNLYINDLELKIDALGKGVEVDDTRFSLLLYKNDIVLIAESEMDLRAMLDRLGAWSRNNLITNNGAKSNILHSRNSSVTRSNFVFKVNDNSLPYVSQYKYLGLVLLEHLDYAVTAKIVAQSVNRSPYC